MLLPFQSRSCFTLCLDHLRVAGAALLLICPAALAAQSRDWSPEERTVLGDFSRVNAVAASMQRVFSVTPDAVLAYDPLARHWEGPYPPRDPGQLRDVFAALVDPIDNSLWMVRRSGWVRFDPGIQLWEQGFLAGSVLDAAFDQNAPGAGLFLRTSTGWVTAMRGGASVPSAPPGRPLRAATAVKPDPYLVSH